MEQHDQERSWKSDPRLHHMDAKKIALLASFADELAAAPEAQRMNLFLDLHRKMRQSNLVFSSEERDLLFSILTENLSPDGRKKAILTLITKTMGPEWKMLSANQETSGSIWMRMDIY